jgi:hypothetical protein
MPLETYEQFESAARALIQKVQYQPPPGGNGEGSTRQDADGRVGLELRRRVQDGSIPVTSGWKWVSGVQHKVSAAPGGRVVVSTTLLETAI